MIKQEERQQRYIQCVNRECAEEKKEAGKSCFGSAAKQ
jgi:hypothetical protein